MGNEANNALSVGSYKSENKAEWNSFVDSSKNGIFLFNRDYMDYHSDRFKDHSLVFSRKGRLIGLLPANLKEGSLCSHGGLTFGGVISDFNMRTQTMMDIFQETMEHCKAEGISKILYKPVPYIYHSIPADEDLYSLFRYNAKLIGRNVTSSIHLTLKRDFDESRQRSIKKALKNNLTVKKNTNFKDFMQILKDVLKERHQVAPVHSLDEMELLASRFPYNIHLFSSYKDDVMLAGVVIYESINVVHAQYIANSNTGRDIGALELVFDYLINQQYLRKKYFDFGISTEEMGQFLNTGLIAHKEGFGGRAVIQDIYEIRVPE